MDLTIRTSTGELLVLRPAVLPGFIPIPGTVSWAFQDDSGTIFIEEFRSGPYTIRFIFIRFVKKISLYWQEQIPFIRARIAIKGNWLFKPGESEQLRLRKDQCLLYYPGLLEILSFDKNKDYRCFDVECMLEKLRTFSPILPGLDELLEQLPSAPVEKIRWVTYELLDIILSIERCSLRESLREYYLEHKLDELMFLLLVNTMRKMPPIVKLPSEQEIDKVNRAEVIIMEDIMKHFSIPMLSRMIGLNELRLKYVFKYVFGEGIFEHLQNARMRQAHQLLENTDLPIKEISFLSGYSHYGNFNTAFREYYGYTPGSIRRKP